MRKLAEGSLGAVLRAARQDAGLTQVELGKILGVTGAVVSLREGGFRKVTVAYLEGVARACRCTFSYSQAGWSWSPGMNCACTEMQDDECELGEGADCGCPCHRWSAEELARGRIVGAKMAKWLAALSAKQGN